jgi:hypothetical protein
MQEKRRHSTTAYFRFIIPSTIFGSKKTHRRGGTLKRRAGFGKRKTAAPYLLLQVGRFRFYAVPSTSSLRKPRHQLDSLWLSMVPRSQSEWCNDEVHASSFPSLLLTAASLAAVLALATRALAFLMTLSVPFSTATADLASCTVLSFSSSPASLLCLQVAYLWAEPSLVFELSQRCGLRPEMTFAASSLLTPYTSTLHAHHGRRPAQMQHLSKAALLQ